MKIKKIVRQSDLGDERYDEKACAYRTPGTLVWGNDYDVSPRKPFWCGGNFDHASSLAEAMKMAEAWEDQHEAAIEQLIAECAKYGFYLSRRKALEEYARHDGAFRVTHPAHLENVLSPMRRVLATKLWEEIWYQISKTESRGSDDQRDAQEQGYSWGGAAARMVFGHVQGVSGKLASFLVKLPLLEGYDFSENNPLFTERFTGE